MKQVVSRTNSIAAFATVLAANFAQAADPLPSWKGTAPKQAIVSFVEKVTPVGVREVSGR